MRLTHLVSVSVFFLFLLKDYDLCDHTIFTGASTNEGAGPVQQATDEGNVVYLIVKWHYFDVQKPNFPYPDEAPKRLQEMLARQPDPRADPGLMDIEMWHTEGQGGE